MRNVLVVVVMFLTGGKVLGQNGVQEPSASKEQLVKMKRSSDKLSAADYQKLTESGTIVLIDFYAPWCGPCKAMEPMLKEFADEQKGKVEVVRINIDENKNLIRSMDIFEIPVVKIYKNGKEVWSRVGVIEKRTITKQLKRL
jgi:thioredoxin